MQARYYDPVIGRFLSNDPVAFAADKLQYFNRYSYALNDPVNMVDPDGRAAIGKGIKFVRKAIANKGDLKKAGKEVLEGIADNIGTLTDGELNGDDLSAATDLITGLDKKDQAAIGGAVKGAKNALPKPPTGKGSVPKGQRDPQRRFTDGQRQEMIDRQGGQCGNGCGKEIDLSNSDGHHIQRHADGGPTTLENGAAVCKDCHKEIHKPE